MKKQLFADYDGKTYNRFLERPCGCDICHRDTPTERFDGYVHGIVWICNDCYNKIKNYKNNSK